MKKMNNFIGILVSYVYIALVIIGAKIFKKKAKKQVENLYILC